MASTHLTKNDFTDKIKTGIALVDFWAEWCIAPETQVAMSRRVSFSADRVTVGNKLLSMGEKGMAEDSVEAAKVVSDGGHCKQVITETGREISTTDDHLFFTNNGWKKAEELKKGDKVAILPSLIKVSAAIANDVVIVSAEMIKVEDQMSKVYIGKYIQELESKKLLPLKLSSEKLPVLARIVGTLFSDGNLYLGKTNNYREINFTLGSKMDVEELMTDLKELSVDKIHVTERRTTNSIQGRKFIAHTFKVKVSSTALWLLFVALGVPRGRKTDVVYRLPNWLNKSSKLIQREFLAAYLGGDGPKVDIRLTQRKGKEAFNSVGINDLEFHKRFDLMKSGLDFAEDVVELLKSFGVKIAKVFGEQENVEWKNGRQSAIIHIRFKHDVESAYAFTNKIGYVYCAQKRLQAEAAGEFLARILQRRRSWQQIYTKTRERALAGKSVKEIAGQLKISAGTVWGWVKQGKKATTNYYREKFDEWIMNAKKGLEDGFMWDVVDNINEIFLPQVARITVAANHNFIANGFVVHNCGPCKMAGPIIDQLSDEYTGKILVAKVDVDAEGELAQKYGVMSIPTVILFKDGVEVGRQVGFAGRQGYLDLLKKVIL